MYLLQACGSAFVDKVESQFTKDMKVIQPAVLLLIRSAAVFEDVDLKTRVSSILARSAQPVHLRKRLVWLPMATEDCLKLFRLLADKHLDVQACGLLIEDMINAVTGKVGSIGRRLKSSLLVDGELCVVVCTVC